MIFCLSTPSTCCSSPSGVDGTFKTVCNQPCLWYNRRHLGCPCLCHASRGVVVGVRVRSSVSGGGVAASMRSLATCGMAWVSFLSQAWRGHKRGHRLAATSGLAPLHLARACVIRRVKITRPWMRILPEHWPRITGVPLDALLTGGIGQGSHQFVTYRIKCSRTPTSKLYYS